jgi:hypothetical protein
MNNTNDVRYKHPPEVRCLRSFHRLLLVPFMAAGCVMAGETLDPDIPPITNGPWYRPSVAARWQWQLQPNATGQINTGYDVGVYDTDLFNTPDSVIAALHKQGRRVLAYFSAGTYEPLRSDARQFRSVELGKTLPDFPAERWLDIRSKNVRQIVLARLDLAVARGFDGVEPDNVDGYSNDSGFPLTAANQLAFNRFIATESHKRGLSVGLKNDLEQVPQLVSYFDFAINEQCHEFKECDALQTFITGGKSVFNAEYAAPFVNNTATRARMCAESRAQNLHTLVLPIALNDSFRLSCDP